MDRTLFVSSRLFVSVLARGASTRGVPGSKGCSVGVGFGSDLSEEPVFRDMPAAPAARRARTDSGRRDKPTSRASSPPLGHDSKSAEPSQVAVGEEPDEFANP